MKKTTLLLIGAFAFVLQCATAQTTLYDDNFEGQTIGNAPMNIGGGNAGNIANFPTTTPPGTDPGEAMWNWVGGGGNGATVTAWQTSTVLDSSGFFTTSAQELSWTDLGNAGSWGFGFSTQAHTTSAAGSGTLADLTLSFDVAVSGTEFATSTTPITIWFDQFPGGNKSLDASILPTITTDGAWNHVSFTLDNIVPSGTSGAYLPYYGMEIAFDAGTGASELGGDTATILIDNVLVTLVPEPGTIALLTLGGLGALVAIRRRS
jgi:PEP-CTERM motif